MESRILGRSDNSESGSILSLLISASSETKGVALSQSMVDEYLICPNIGESQKIELPASVLIDEIIQFTQLGEGISISFIEDEPEQKKEPCKKIFLHAFRGARDKASIMAFKQSLKAHEVAGTNGPDGDECLLYTGHVGISFDAKSPVYGFNPDTGSLPGWKVINALKDKKNETSPYPGVVTDDTSVFNKAKALKLEYKILEFIYPESEYNKIHSAFQASKGNTGLTYSFPGQGGDCNCATWPREIGVQIPCGNGAMKIYINSFDNNEVRRMGDCCDK